MKPNFPNNIVSDEACLKFWLNDLLGTIDFGYQSAIVNYILYGVEPGSFFKSWFRRDWAGLILHSHPANGLDFLKRMVSSFFYLPHEMTGDCYYTWLKLSDKERREVLVERGMVRPLLDILKYKGESSV